MRRPLLSGYYLLLYEYVLGNAKGSTVRSFHMAVVAAGNFLGPRIIAGKVALVFLLCFA